MLDSLAESPLSLVALDRRKTLPTKLCRLPMVPHMLGIYCQWALPYLP